MNNTPIDIAREVSVLKTMMLVSIFSAAASAELDLTNGAPMNGNAFFMVIVCGALGGAFLSAFMLHSTAETIRAWTGRMFFASVTAILFSPSAIYWLNIVPNARNTLAFSALVALCSKLIIRELHEYAREWIRHRRPKD